MISAFCLFFVFFPLYFCRGDQWRPAQVDPFIRPHSVGHPIPQQISYVMITKITNIMITKMTIIMITKITIVMITALALYLKAISE